MTNMKKNLLSLNFFIACFDILRDGHLFPFGSRVSSFPFCWAKTLIFLLCWAFAMWSMRECNLSKNSLGLSDADLEQHGCSPAGDQQSSSGIASILLRNECRSESGASRVLDALD